MKLNKKQLELYVFLTAAFAAVLGFLFSRAVLSISTIILCANGFLWGDIREKWQAFKQQPFLIGLTLLFFIPLISGLWSNDIGLWWFRCQQKIPLLFLPFSLIHMQQLKSKHIVQFHLLWILTIFLGSLWSLSHYIGDPDQMIQLYKVSKVLPTWAEDDHIRFTIAIIISILFALYMEQNKSLKGSAVKWMIRGILIWLVIFLHIISVKTGLIGLYFVILPVYGIHLWKKKKALSILLIFIALSTLGLSVRMIPTLRERINYMMYDHNLWSNEKFTGTDSDSNRILSLKAGWQIWKNNFLAGVGYGDLRSEVDKWFDKNVPIVKSEYRFLPLNQWIFAGSTTGIVGVIIFSLIICFPFFNNKWTGMLPSLCFWIFMTILFTYESTIEDQRGVYLFSFMTLWWHLLINLNHHNKLS
jgi:O-antigen ligase